MTEFLGIAFGVLNEKLCAVATSTGIGIVDRAGLTTRECLAFLWSLSYVRQKRVPVMFNSAVDFELLVRDLTGLQKDSLFGVTRYLEEKAKDTPFYEPPPVNGREVTEALGYRLSALPGKVFRLAKGKRQSLTMFDIESFFACDDIGEASEKFLGERMPVIEREVLGLWEGEQERALLNRCFAEAGYVERLALKVATVLEPLDLKIKQWYGPSAVAARCLTKWNARRQAKRLHEKNSASELLKAIDCALFGGRTELLMTGTVKDVRIYDLNSAYAYAVTLLSQFYKPLAFTRAFEDHYQEPFSVWLVDYELPPGATLGVLPTRAATGAISYRSKGRGYYWQPEVDYLRQRYPDSFEVKWGYAAPYKQVTFAEDVHALYDYRGSLKDAGDAGESIIKLSLANLYGKFSQNTGKAHFQCRAWAGWITSLIRRLLLEAVTGIEDKVICFCQDAVHMTGASCAVELGTGLGQWKTERYAQGMYTAPGLYTLDEAAKEASRGINLGLDWDRIATDLSERQVAELERSFFVGYRLSRLQAAKYKDKYLSEVHEALTLVPSRLRARHYQSKFNWHEESRDSRINRHFDGRLSRRYVPQEVSNSALRLKLKERGFV